MPKQFVKLFDDKSLFQLTVERNSNVCSSQLIVSNAEQYFLALDQLEEMAKTENRYILEPVGRNTAPAIALACMTLDSDELVLVTPSDHLITDIDQYTTVLHRAGALASEGFLVTFGIKPSFAETGFGYIESEGEIVRAFHEKPDTQTAQRYVDAGNYYWNSGMFCFKVGVFLNELEKHASDIYETCKIAVQNQQQIADNQMRITHHDMIAIPENSIDYAIMEKSSLVRVVKSDIGWSDVGCFDALAEHMPNDKHNNLILSDKPVSLIDVSDLIIIDTDDALLITKKGSSQKVKEIVAEHKQTNPELTHIHRTAHRPWGTYTILEDTVGYKIKRITVKPGKRLSLQKHFHRNEHWIVLSGTATVTVGEQTYLVHPNESTYIKSGELHRLANMGKIPLVIIEAQVGEYTGEDDIVRVEDDYDRGENK